MALTFLNEMLTFTVGLHSIMFCKHELERCHQCDACQMPYDDLCCD